ncbi:alpha/beta hydrolase family protein [Nocardia altamirensis]|uniref:alpha/beta hydrolase family protein n=1 Tax=Nocardia altamirensis TaxID=472158 RepID=UPI0008408F9B|nr:acetylhydrolase [Nocardia altamirensis]
MRIAAALVLALATALSVVACSSGTTDVPSSTESAAVDTKPVLRPSGPSAVGRDVLHLVDSGRTDPWTPGTPRELMVSMYYPAQRGGGAHAPYATTAESRAMLVGLGLDKEVPAEVLAAVHTNSVEGAPPVDGSHPLVVLSPGFTAPRYTLTALSEELASRGYVVAVVDHAGESFGTEFPGGRMSTCVACQRTDEGEPLTTIVETRARDVAFLLDRLTGPQPSWPHAKLIDRTRIGMAGHSIGGAATAETMATDQRVRAGLNMDGTFFGDAPLSALGDRPFLLFGTDADTRPGGHDPSWDRAWSELPGWKRWLTVVGTDHNSFIDTVMHLEQAATQQDSLSGRRAVEITRAHVAAFFDQHLRGIHQPLLDHPDPAYPEVRFNNP